MVCYKLTGKTGYSIKVFRRFEVITPGHVTLMYSPVVRQLKEDIMQEFPGKEFQFSVSFER